MIVKAELEKQDIAISDGTGTARLTLWQENIGKLEVDNLYEIKDLIVNSYNGAKYLTSPKSGCTITSLDDIHVGAIEEESEDEPGKNQLTDAEVAAVTNYTSAKVCISCKAKVDPTNDRIGHCMKCSTVQ